MLFIVGLDFCLGWIVPSEFYIYSQWAHFQHDFILETPIGCVFKVYPTREVLLSFLPDINLSLFLYYLGFPRPSSGVISQTISRCYSGIPDLPEGEFLVEIFQGRNWVFFHLLSMLKQTCFLITNLYFLVDLFLLKVLIV